MLEKSTLSLFGLAVMLICLNPPKANAGTVVAFGPTYPAPVRVYRPAPYRYVAPAPYVAYQPYPYAYGPSYVRPGWSYRPGFYGNGYWGPRRIEHREFVVRRPNWRR
jgi:hypothetical protein